MKTKFKVLNTLSLSLLSSMSTACGTESNELNLNLSPSEVKPTPSVGVSQPEGSQQSGDSKTQAPALIKVCDSAAIPARKVLNVQYQQLANVDANLQSLDIHFPVVESPCQGVPVVIWIHGGGWMIGDKSQVEIKAQHFNSLGYGFVSVNYRLSPDLRVDTQLNPSRIKFPDHPSDVGAAVAWIHKNIKNYGGNNQQLAILGHSAGAHLAALVSQDQSYIQKADPNWNPKSLRCLGSYDTEAYNINSFMQTAIGTPRLIYRNAFGDDPAAWTQASPINFIKEYGMAVQLAKRGESERHAQLESFRSALESKQNKVSVIDAQTLTHEEVNRLIGAAGDTVMTPFVTEFIKQSCFPN